MRSYKPGLCCSYQQDINAMTAETRFLNRRGKWRINRAPIAKFSVFILFEILVDLPLQDGAGVLC